MFGRLALKPALLQPLECSSSFARLSVARKYSLGQDGVDIVHVPLKALGVLTDFYVPPRLSSCPISTWPKVFFRSLGAYGLSTYFVGKYKQDTKLKLRFSEWKDLAMERYLKTNKIFAAACSQSPSQRKAYIETQLDGIASTDVISSLATRAKSFPVSSRLEWRLKKLERTPQVKVFQIIPDRDEVVALLQLVIRFDTKQEMIVHKENGETQRTERVLTDHIVMTLNPYTKDMVLAGTLFPASPYRYLRPKLDGSDMPALLEFQRICADIYRASPAPNKL